MKFERTKNSTRTFAFGVINKLITVLCPFITRTIIIYKLGAEYLGLTSLFTSVLTILNVSELGISSAVSFCLYKPIAEDDKDTINALMNFMKKIYRVIGILILTVGLCLMPFLDKIISGTYPEGMNIYILYVLYLLNSVVSYLGFAYKSVLFEAYQHGDVNHKILSVVEIIKYVVQIAVLLIFENYYIYVVILPISSIMITLITEWYSKKYFPEIVPNGELSKDYRKLIKNKVTYLAAHSIAATLTNTVDNIVISGSLGLVAIAVYGNYSYIKSSVIGIIIIAYRALTPTLGNSMYTDTIDKYRIIAHSVELLTMWSSAFCSICLLCLYQPFIELWVGEEYMLDLVTVILIVLFFYANSIKLSYSDMFIQAAGLWNKTLFREYIVAGLNLVLDVVLVGKYGIGGIVFSSFFSNFFVGLPLDVVVTYKYIFKERVVIGLTKIVKNLICMVVFGTVTFWACSVIKFSGWTSFVIKVIICIILPNISFGLVECKTKEFSFLKGKVKETIFRGNC